MEDGLRRRSIIQTADGDSHVTVDEQSKTIKKEEGGFGWFVVVAAFIVHVTVDGRCYCMGALLPALIDKFDNKTVDKSWVMAVLVATVSSSGPLSSAVDVSVGHCWTAFIGGVVAILGTLATIYAQQLWHVILSFGIVTGTGLGMTYLASVAALTEWFHEKKALAMGIAVTGTGVGTFAFNAGYSALYRTLGWGGLFQVLTGVAAVSCLIAPLLLSPKSVSNQRVESHKKKNWNFKKALNRTKKTLKASFSLSMLKNHAFVIYLFTDFMISVSMFIPYDFLVVRVQVELPELSDDLAAWLPSILGIATIFGQLASGLLSLPRIHRSVDHVTVLAVILVFHGIFAALSALCGTYLQFAVYAAATGILDGLIHTLTPVVCYEIAGEELFISAWGVQMFLQGVGCVVGPVAAGALIDHMGHSYWRTFVIFGANMSLGGLVLLFVPLSNHFPIFNCSSQPESDELGIDNHAMELWMTSRRMTPRNSLGAASRSRRRLSHGVPVEKNQVHRNTMSHAKDRCRSV